MEEIESLGLADYASILRRRRWQLIVPAVIVFIISAVVAVAIPATYTSRATILIEQQEIPQDLVRSTVTSYADKRVQTISQRVMTTSNLGKIIEKYELYPDERKRFTLATVVEQMRGDITLNMISADVVDPRSGRAVVASIAFTLAYRSESPEKAQKVANEILSLFLNENIKERRKAAQEASQFLAEESDKLALQIANLEAKAAEFKQEHGESLPEMQSLNMDFLRRTEERLSRNDQDVRVLDERIIYLESELAQIDPYSKLYSVTGERVLSAADRLSALESQRATLAARYSADHPDRITLERELAALRLETNGEGGADLQRTLTDLERELVTLRERYSAEHPDVKRKQREIEDVSKRLVDLQNGKPKARSTNQADNPAYIQLQARLQAARVERSSLRKAREVIETELKQLEQRLAAAPTVEREYRAMMREYGNAVLKFKEMKDKQVEAELAESLETESKAERFTVVEPPLQPEEPTSPNRIAILFLGFVASLGSGVANLAVRESLDNSVHGPKALAAIVGMPPMAVIPHFQTDEDRARRRWRRLLLAIGLLALLVAALVAIHFLFRPLDVLYFQVLQKAGLY